MIYLLCFDLSTTVQEQRDQISYWLKFLQSSITTLPQSHSTTGSSDKNWSVIVVGLKDDAKEETAVTASSIQSWQSQMVDLPLFNNFFEVSSHQAPQSVRDLLASISLICSQIFDQHTAVIPNSYRKLLQSIKSIHTSDLHTSSHPDLPLLVPFKLLHSLIKGECDMDLQSFKHALHHFHAIGQIVFLQNELVCPTPAIIPKLLAKFVSPAEVQNLLLTQNSDVQILTQQQIGFILQVHSNNAR